MSKSPACSTLHLVKIPTFVKYSSSFDLSLRQLEAAAKLPPNSIKGRKPKPVDLERLPV